MKREILQVCTIATLGLSLTVFAGGCAKKELKSEEMQAPTAQTAVTPPPAPKADVGEGMGTEEPLASKPWLGSGGETKILEGRTTAPMLPVYFDFDKSNIRSDQQDRMIANAEFIKEYPVVTIRIEGNCDERGTNEYNMALGERRAMSAKKYLINLGIADDRLQTISYGEERPLNHGHDELAWSQNRRDDFVIMNR